MRLKTLLAAASLMAICAANSANAETFEFKYTFANGMLVDGYFSGTVSIPRQSRGL